VNLIVGKVEPQVPPLRYASVGMTKARVVTFIRAVRSDGQKRNNRSLHSLRFGRDDKFV
jgi:hypothetical protein